MEQPLPKDRAEIAKLIKKSLCDIERKKRFFNPATITIGVSQKY